MYFECSITFVYQHFAIRKRLRLCSTVTFEITSTQKNDTKNTKRRIHRSEHDEHDEQLVTVSLQKIIWDLDKTMDILRLSEMTSTIFDCIVTPGVKFSGK